MSASFRCGLELHVQLNTGKLFCSCPSKLSNKVSGEIVRRFTMVSGEVGGVDPAAVAEKLKGKKVVYKFDDETSCLVELDEEPPHPVNVEALRTALIISKLLNCELFDDLIVMRKTIIDGSVPTGFQRTMLVGFGGFVETSKGKVRVSYVSLEEDSARKLRESRDSVVYKLDRLGIPLVEIGTEPDITDFDQVFEVAKKLGELTRSTDKVMRGLGTIRQDVNVSVRGGARVELKGVQDLKMLPLIVKKEVDRQLALLERGERVVSEVRRVKRDGSSVFLRPMPGSARLYPETDLEPVSVKGLEFALPKSFEDRVKELVGKGVDRSSAELVVKKFWNYYEPMVGVFDDAKLVVELLLIGRSKVSLSDYLELLKAVKRGDLLVSGVRVAVQKLLKGDDVRVVIVSLKPVKLVEVEKRVDELLRSGVSERNILGLVMRDFRGRVDPVEVVNLVKRVVSRK